MQPLVRPARVTDDVAGFLTAAWGDPVMAVHGRLYDLLTVPALVAEADEALVGVLTFVVEDLAVEIVSCDARPTGRGTGRALVAAARDIARQTGARRVWCTTTNDNLPALGFWQACGFVLIALRRNAVEDARRLKPSIPKFGYRGLPIRDELDLEIVLD